MLEWCRGEVHCGSDRCLQSGGGTASKSPCLFAVVMERLTEEVRQESLCMLMFADDIVICSESREQVEENLERWRYVLESRGMTVSHNNTEYMKKWNSGATGSRSGKRPMSLSTWW